ncbi:hypothetical protein [Arthrobacter sp. OV608]|uniref:hypothetical protein n=1 Tax=Arthrobacter sp. OV608 TaxID=1882768 RepID=UPI000B85F432|nr:hypothetical protein [Arthrobacter sp. OV608]
MQIEFCGEWYPVTREATYTIGRDADLVVDENPFLHRRLLQVSWFEGFWVLANIGSRMAVTVTDGAGRLQSWLAPGGRLPLVFARTTVVFTAGPTTYELSLHAAEPPFSYTDVSFHEGATTVGSVTLTESQRVLIVALAEQMLRFDGSGRGEIPTNAKASERLGWALTRFNRKLDNVCDKLDRIGVQGMRGDVSSYATNRRIRLVEYAITSRLVTRADLALLEKGVQ